MDKKKKKNITSIEIEVEDELEMLRRKYNLSDLTAEEMADAYVFPNELSAGEMATANAEMKALRMQYLESMTKEQKLEGNLYGFRYRMGEYVKKGKFAADHSFGTHLKKYLELHGKTEQEFASDIHLSLAEVQGLLRGTTTPLLGVFYRLEKHSGNIIPALLWWKLLAMEVENLIRFDAVARENEGRLVNVMPFSTPKTELVMSF